MIRASILEYGVGNLHSLQATLRRVGVDSAITPRPEEAITTDILVLPSLGTFHLAAERLAPSASALRSALQSGLPCVAIGVGMQLLFEQAEDVPVGGLSAVPGVVRRLGTARLPHLGWNHVVAGPDPLFHGQDLVGWFDNSLVVHPRDPRTVVAWAEHDGHQLPAAIRAGRTIGLQFRPEKSGAAGAELLAAVLAEMAA